MTNFFKNLWKSIFGTKNKLKVSEVWDKTDPSYNITEKVIDELFESDKKEAAEAVTSVEVLSELDHAIRNCKNCTDVVFTLNGEGQLETYYASINELGTKNKYPKTRLQKEWKAYNELPTDVRLAGGAFKFKPFKDLPHVEIVKLG